MSQFYKEVLQQPEAIRNTVRSSGDLGVKAVKPLLFTGMGSSLAASELLVSYLNNRGIQASAVDNSELLYYGAPEWLESMELFITSQSGESYEAKELAKRQPSFTAITNTQGSSLAEKAGNVIYTHAGKEEAIASSKSFTTTAALLLLLGSQLTGEEEAMRANLLAAADVLEGEFAKIEEYRARIGKFVDVNHPLILLGRGPSLITAKQGALTLKETARLYTEAQSGPQFRHGPFELLKENLQAVFFNPKGVTYSINRSYVLEMAELGARVLYVSDEPLEHANIVNIVIPSVEESVSVIPYSLVTQLAAVELSEQKGLVAGQASIISKVTGKE